jgi:hypothetical protein
LLAALLIGEPITADLVLGLIAVFAGIWLATSKAREVTSPRTRGEVDREAIG